MKIILWLLSAPAIFIFLITAYGILREPALHRHIGIVIPELKGFQNDEQAVVGLKELTQNYSKKIKAYNKEAEKHHKAWLWISFVVTALTAGSALVAAIKAARNRANNVTALIIIAILTFLAMLGTWGTTQVNELRNTVTGKSARVAERRTNFFLEYQKANDVNTKTALVENYQVELDTL